jgi:hypothetical protein
MGVYQHFQQYFSYIVIVEVRLIGGGNQNTLKSKFSSSYKNICSLHQKSLALSPSLVKIA